MPPLHRIILSAGLAALSASSFGATTVYTSQASFLAQLAPGAYTETFDGLSNTPPDTYAKGGFSYTLSSPDGLYSGGSFLETNQESESLTISFTSGNVYAVGGDFYAVNYSDVFQSTVITLKLSDNTTTTFTPTSVTDYRGYTSTSKITSLTISAPATSLYAAVDNLTVGALPAVAAVPEPSSALLMVLGTAGLWVVRRRRS